MRCGAAKSEQRIAGEKGAACCVRVRGEGWVVSGFGPGLGLGERDQVEQLAQDMHAGSHGEARCS